MTTPLPINIHVATRLIVYGKLPQQLKRANSHPQLSGELLGSSPNGISLRKGSLNWNSLGGLTPKPLVELYEWLALDPRIFMPPWYPTLTTKPTSKLPNQKLQYPTYMKDTNPNTHIKVFKKAIRINGEIVEADIINLFGFI